MKKVSERHEIFRVEYRYRLIDVHLRGDLTTRGKNVLYA